MTKASLIRAGGGVRAAILRRLGAAVALAAALALAAPEAAVAGPSAEMAERAMPTLGVGQLINAERRARGLRPLGRDGRLRAAAFRHAADMGLGGFFSHHGSDGRDHGNRIAAQGFRACLAAENIAWGQRSAAEVVRGWMNSPGHRKIILHPRATAYGAGYHPTRRQWVLEVARPC